MKYNNNHNGFTLVELAILFVIISLVIVSVLVGKNLIENAKKHHDLSFLQKLNQVTATFHMQYNGLPGDYAGAKLTGASGLGNGDGRITYPDGTSIPPYNDIFLSSIDNPIARGDAGLVWHHLSVAGLMDGDYESMNGAASIIKGIHSPIVKTTKSRPELLFFRIRGHIGGFDSVLDGGHYSVIRGISPETAYYFDVKLDDGVPKDGKLLVVIGVLSGNLLDIQTSTSYASGSAQKCVDEDGYYLENQNKKCIFAYKILGF